MTTATQEKNGNDTKAARGVKKIAQRVKGGKIVKINLGELRDELGNARIGRKVLGSMAEFLNDNGIGAFPAWVLNPEANPEPRQWQEVWVYERDGSTRASLIEAFGNPDANDLSGVLDMFLSDAPDFSKMDDTQRLAFVRAAVCKK